MSAYRVIYADPPWHYRDRAQAGERGASFKYRLTTTAELARLDVASLADTDCALFMWSTAPLLPDALQLMQAWGFRYSTVAFVWVKTSAAGRLAWGMGQSTRANAELVLLGLRGRLRRVSGAVHQVVQAPRRQHSQKPDEVRDRIVALLGDVPRVELFARQRVPGWDAWGDQTPGGCDVEVLPC